MDEPTHLDFSKVRLVGFDFDGVFTDNAVYVDQDGRESVRCSRSDGIGLKRLADIGVKTVVISTETNQVVRLRCEKLRIRCFHGVGDKLDQLRQVMREHGVLPEQTVFVGNDINDLDVMNHVGFPVAVADAYPEVRAAAVFCTTRPGGYGAVRELCDLIYESLNQNEA